jgi:hypothetical protein
MTFFRDSNSSTDGKTVEYFFRSPADAADVASQLHKCVVSNSRLVSLSLRGPWYSRDQAEHTDELLAHTLQSLNTNHARLRKLDLAFLLTGQKGADALSTLLHTSTSLRKLDFFSFKLPSDGWLAVAAGLKHSHYLQELRVDWAIGPLVGCQFHVDVLTHCRGLVNLTTCAGYVSFCASASRDIAQALAGNTTLLSLRLTSGDVSETQSPDAMYHFAWGMRMNTTLQKLAFDASDLSMLQAFTRGVLHTQTLKYLKLDGPSLGELGSRAVAMLLESNMCLDRLILPVLSSGGACIGKALETNSSLKHLSMTMGLEYWEDYVFPAYDITALGQGLSRNTTLQQLDLALASQGSWADLWRGLRTNTSLRGLSVEYSSGGMLEFANMLAHTTSLQHFDFTCMVNIAEDGPDQESVTKALAKNQSLKSIRLAGPSGGALCSVLTSHPKLTELTLVCFPPYDSVLQLQALLQHGTRLRKLHIDNYGDKDALDWDKFASALPHNSTLQSLELSNATPAGWASVAAALRQNHTIRYVGRIQSMHEKKCMDGASDVARAVCQLLMDTPRLHPLRWHNICDLSVAVDSLGLPPRVDDDDDDDGDGWQHDQIIEHMHSIHMEKACAFLMGHHVRLGAQASVLRSLNRDCFNMVMLGFFGLPWDYFEESKRDHEYVPLSLLTSA